METTATTRKSTILKSNEFQALKNSVKGHKMIIESKDINLLKEAKKVTIKEVAYKPKKDKKPSLHKSLLNVNKLDKLENFSLSSAINRFKKQLPNDEQYNKIDTNVIDNGLKFDTILAFVNQKCIEKQKFSVYAIGLAFNKYIKTI